MSWSEQPLFAANLLIVSEQAKPCDLERMLGGAKENADADKAAPLFATKSGFGCNGSAYRITTVHDRDSAETIVDSKRGVPDFVFVDLDHTQEALPLVRHLQQAHPDLPLGLYTEHRARQADILASMDKAENLLWVLGDTRPQDLREELSTRLVPPKREEKPVAGVVSSSTDSVDAQTQLDVVRAELQRQVDANRQLELERDTLQAQIRQLEKTNALGMLAGGIAHDFNNILAALLGFTELSLAEAPPETRIASNLNHVLTATRRAKDLVEQILAFSRRGNGEPQPVQVHLVAREAVKFLRATLPSTIEIESKINRQLQPVLAEPTQIHQVILNLATNAAQAIGNREGRLEIHLQSYSVTNAADVPCPGMTPAGYNHLRVSDTGCGIEPEVLDHMFEPFFTAGKPNGTGMGLALVESIVGECGGYVTVSSEVGLGTTFDIYLPVTDRAVDASGKPTVSLRVGHGERILLVDDEQPIVQVEQQILHRLGYQVVSCTSSLAALELVRAQPEQFRLVITDQTMPHMTGVELARAIGTLNPDLPIILSSGFSDVVLPPEGERGNIRCFIKKPAVMRELGEMIYEVLNEHAVTSV